MLEAGPVLDDARAVSAFERALEENRVAAALGDVSLRYEPSMMVAETAKAAPTWRPLALLVAGFVSITVGLGWLVFAGELGAASLIGSGGLAIGASTWLARREKRKRGFVVNFATSQLRLDFVTPFAGKPRTLIVPFDDVKAIALEEQADGARCLTVDFEWGGDLLREVLVAFIAAREDDAARRLARLLEGAFGLGAIPPDSPFLEATHEVEVDPAPEAPPPKTS